MTINAGPPPEVGQAVRVRNRLATVRAVEPYDTRMAQGRLNIVDVEYLDDFRYPEAEQLLWEVEPEWNAVADDWQGRASQAEEPE